MPEKTVTLPIEYITPDAAAAIAADMICAMHSEFMWRTGGKERPPPDPKLLEAFARSYIALCDILPDADVPELVRKTPAFKGLKRQYR